VEARGAIEMTVEELRAIEENMVAGYALWGRHPRALLRRDRELTVVAGNVPHPMVNFVLGAHFSREEDARIDEIVSLYERRRSPFMWYVGPLSRPLDLEARLLKRGFKPAGAIVGMVLRELAPLQPLGPDATVERLAPDDRASLEAANRIAAIAFGMPREVQKYVAELVTSPEDGPVTVYLARVGGVPAATAVFAPTLAAGGLYNVATLPEHRRLGLASHLVARAIDEARPLGLPMHVLQATSQARHLYETLGFEWRCEIRMYLKE
jgi:GNAT superfamily N-acetyltransferase